VSSVWDRLSLFFDGAFVASICAFAVLALAPFNGTAVFQGAVAWAAGVLVFGCMLLGSVRGLFAPSPLVRACAVAAGLGMVYLGLLLDGWARSSAARTASALAQGLSATRFELPWVALLMAMSLGALSVLQFFALRRLLLRWPDQTARVISFTVALGCAGLLLRALIAYSSGSASLFVTRGG